MFGRLILTIAYLDFSCRKARKMDALGHEAPLDCLRHNPADAYPSGGVLHFRSVL